MTEEKQIEEMAKCCTYYHGGECFADATHPEKCDLMCEMFGVFSNLAKDNYLKKSEGEWERRAFIIFDSEKIGYRCTVCHTTWDPPTNFCPPLRCEDERRMI